tara:strand:+ start:171 stop:557 length:387 start_codon:yes stop_codon:yes gene_type:complete
MKVLVVDDDDLVRAMMVKILISAGYCVDESVNGADAIEQLKVNIYDIVVTDIVMPGKSGISVGEYIKSNNLPVSVLAVSAHGADSGMLDFAKYYVDDTLQKPFGKKDFLKAMGKLSGSTNISSALMNL